jgi:geranylgeranyl reductase family protein
MAAGIFDVAVVGAGPAGARAACLLARAGARVVVIDASHPREKPCGGGVTGRALEAIADQRPAAGDLAGRAVSVRRAIFAQEGLRAEVSLEGPSRAEGPPLLVIDRLTFDRLLLARAVDAGAVPIAARVREVSRHADGWRLLTSGPEMEAQHVIGADGANSLVRRRLLRPFDRSQISVATGYFLHGATSDTIDVEFEANPAGYLWSFPRPDHLALGVCAQADEAGVSRLRLIADAWIDRAALPGHVRREPYSWPIPSLTAEAVDAERPAGRGWTLVGDAAGLVDPITREGIYFALRSGELAAHALLRSRDPSAAYIEALRDDILPELYRAAQLKAGFFRPEFTRLLIRALATSAAVRSVMADLVAGRQSYRRLIPRLIATLEVRLAWNLLRLKLGRL